MLINEITTDPENDVLVFAHIPKTAGISFIRAIEEKLGPQACLRTRSEKLDRIYAHPLLRLHANARIGLSSLSKRILGHHPLISNKDRNRDLSKIRFMSGHISPGAEPPTGRTHHYVSLVRNPIDLFISRYYYVLDNLASWPPKKIFGNPTSQAIGKLGIEDYITWLHGQQDQSYRDIQCKHLAGLADFAAARVVVDKKMLLCAPVTEMPRFLELLGRAWRLGELRVLRENTGKRRPQEIQLSTKAVSKLEQMYEQDFRLYEYVAAEFSKVSFTS